MSAAMVSSWKSRRVHRRAEGRTVASPRSAFRRRLACEPLEDRELLSVVSGDAAPSDLEDLVVRANNETIAVAAIGEASPPANLLVSTSQPETIGLFNPTPSTFLLRNTNSSGYADITFNYGPANAHWIPLAGNWTGLATKDTIGLYDPINSVFFLKNANESGYADISFQFGLGDAGWIPLAGDWNSDGTDTVGLYDPSSSVFFLRNSNTSGYADITFQYGPAGGNLMPIVGDWNDDLQTTIGLFDQNASVFYLRNSNTSGYSDMAFSYGPEFVGWTPIVGDWVGDGMTTVGLYDPMASAFYLRYVNEGGYANVAFSYGPVASGWTPIAGQWIPASGSLTAAIPITSQSQSPALTADDLRSIVGEAIADWTEVGLDAALLERLSHVEFVIDDLSGSRLGTADGNTVSLDRNAAGYGWFVDPTPSSDEEYVASSTGHRLQAIDPHAVDRIDLLTVVEHELGHIAGLVDLDVLADGVMRGMLDSGMRRRAVD